MAGHALTSARDGPGAVDPGCWTLRAQSCAIGTVQVRGVDTNKAVQQLWDKWHIIATPINHPEYTGIRVTPNVYTTLEEIDTFGDAMEKIAAGS